MKNIFFFLLISFFSILKIQSQSAFITTWKTTIPNETITIPTTGTGYNYTVDWGDTSIPTVETGNATHTYATPGTYTVSISGDFPRIYFNDTGDKDKILTIEQWGNIAWRDMSAAFKGCTNLQGNFTDAPDLSIVTSMNEMFMEATSFDYPLNNWDVSNVRFMSRLFNGASSFNQDLDGWDVSSATFMTSMFQSATVFEGSIGNWNVSSVTNMEAMFQNAINFNQDIGNWNVSLVTDMNSMFNETSSFNRDISFKAGAGLPIGDAWNVANVENMWRMFADASNFNQDIGNWNVIKVTDFGLMFSGATIFDKDIGTWDVQSATNMSSMFSRASVFNQDIGNWNVSNVQIMISMFSGATAFNQDIGDWNVSNLISAPDMFVDVTLSTENYDALLIGWNAQNLQSGVAFSGGNSQYCSQAASDARESMSTIDTWLITDGGRSTDTQCNDGSFITTWETTTANESITVPTIGGGYNYSVDWGDNTPITIETGNAVHSYAIAGTYAVSITGTFPRVYFNASFSDQATTDAQKEIASKIKTIEQWGDNPWRSMQDAFAGCVNLNITNSLVGVPDLSNVTNTERMFANAQVFNWDIGNWDVSTITDMSGMFSGASLFNQDIGNWNTSNVTDMIGMFNGATEFNQDVSFKQGLGTPFGDAWDTSNVTDMSFMFAKADAFNWDIGNWNTSNVTGMTGMFESANLFNQDIGNWNTVNVTNMSLMFSNATSFDKNIGSWNVAKVTNMIWMFNGASAFNKDIGNWDVSSVENMWLMFSRAIAFNQDISRWNVSNVTNMSSMFDRATAFDQDISFKSGVGIPSGDAWNVSGVTDMSNMFSEATKFNQDIGNWNVSSVTELDSMFSGALLFNQNIGGWDVSKVTNASDMFKDIALSTENYDALLIGWNAQNLQPNVTFSGGNSQYCSQAAADARESMSTIDTWLITDGGRSADTQCNDGSFITTWETTTANESITVPTIGGGYNYSVDWGDNTPITIETGNAVHSYAIAGTYTVSIMGTFPRIYFNASFSDQATTDAQKEIASKIKTIEQWGDNPWRSMQDAFAGCVNLNITNSLVGVPDLSNVTNTERMFANAQVFNWDIGNWDVSTITDMSGMFSGASLFNQDIGNWNTSNVTDMIAMFSGATDFDKDLSFKQGLGTPFGDAWDTSNVTDMSFMFAKADAFNWDIGNWNTSNVTGMTGMFESANLFNQDIGNWNTVNVTNMSLMFSNATSFDKNIGSWNVAKVTNMIWMFNGASAFNKDIGNWDVSSVENMWLMFSRAIAFNQDISRWNVSNVTNMSSMFDRATAFDQDISSKSGVGIPSGDAWNVSGVTDMSNMFSGATKFNQDIGNWNVSSVTELDSMFSGALLFNQNIGGWDVSKVTNASDMFKDIALSTENYDALLIGWNAQNLQPNVTFSGGNSQYCAGELARMNMISPLSDNWIITDGGSANPTADVLSGVTACASYELPVLSSDNRYYTASGAGGTELFAGGFINTTQEIYIYTGGASCNDESSFTVTINGMPTADVLTDVIECTSYELPVLSTGNSYYTASGAGGIQLSAGDFINTTQEIYIYAGDVTCNEESSFTVTINGMPTADVLSDVTECTSYELPVLSTGNSYYTASGATGTQLLAGDFINTTQEIYIYTGVATCNDESSFTVTINGMPTADVLTDVIECTSYELPVLSTGNSYYTASGAGGIQLSSGDFINTTQEIYIYAGDVTCNEESSFTVTINGMPTADVLSDVTECTSYELPVLSTGNSYYTASGATGTQLTSGDFINTTQEIYIYTGTATCNDESSFTIAISGMTIAEVLSDVAECTSYELPVLSTGNSYYTASGATGTQLLAGTTISVTQEVYIYTGDASCNDESSFMVVINNPEADVLSNINECTSYQLPTLSTGNNYYTESGGLGTQLSPGESINITQEIFIYKGNTTCNDESSFIVDIDNENCSIDDIVFPTAFTPNNDGVNDLYEIIGLEKTYPNFSIKIYNRNGFKLFNYKHNGNSSVIPQWWNGEYDGKIVPNGVYFYTIEFNKDAIAPKSAWIYLN